MINMFGKIIETMIYETSYNMREIFIIYFIQRLNNMNLGC
jgi:hypothetical protein